MRGLVRRHGLVGTRPGRRARTRGWVLAVVAAMAVTLAPTGPAGASEPSAPLSGDITGFVADGFAAPLPFVDVAVLDAATTAAVGSALTDTTGHFTVAGLAPGTYLVAYSKGGFAWQLHDGAADQAAATPVVLTAGTVVDLAATLEWTGGITGTVLDDAGAPVVGGVVTASGAAGTRAVTTAADGTYRVSLPAGDYSVAFPAAVGDVSYEPEWWDGAAAADAAGTVTVPAVGFVTAGAQLVRTPSLWRGTVTDAGTGAPVPSVVVDVRGPDQRTVASFITGPDGTYAFPALPDGTYGAWFVDLGYDDYFARYIETIVVARGRLTVRDVALEPLSRLSGTVLDPFGHAVPGAAVVATRDGMWWAQDTSAGEGAWETPYAMRGPVVVYGYAPGYVTTWFGGATSAAAAVPVEIGPGEDRSDLDLVLEWTSGISGVLSTESGAPAPGVTITATGDLGTRSTVTDAAGAFTMALPAGDYTVAYAGPGYLDGWYDGAVAVEEAVPVTVAPAAYTPIEDVVLSAYATLSGTVTDTDGGPVVGLRVLITNELTSEYWIAHTDAAGHYRAAGLTAGEYAVYFDTSRLPIDYFAEYYDDAATLDVALRLPIGPSDDLTGVDAVLVRRASISGTVTDGLARPAPVDVALVDPETGTTLDVVPTAPDGSYAFGDVWPGAYLVRVLGRGVFLDEFVGGGDDHLTATAVPVAEGADVDLDATAHWLGGVTGTVLDEHGAPAVGVRVDATGPQGTLTGYTGPDGRYVLDLPADVHQVRIESGSTDPVYEVVTVPDVTVATSFVELGIRQLLVDYGSVSGSIRTSQGWYIGNDVQVTVWTADAGGAPGELTTTANGSFTIGGLTPGDYVILAEPDGGWYRAFYGGGDDLATATRVTVGYGDVLTGLDIVLPSLGSIGVHVQDRAGNAVVGAQVELLDRETGEVLDSAVTGDEHYTSFWSLPPGQYTFRASAPGYRTGYFYDSPTFEDSNSIAVTDGEMWGAGLIMEWASGVRGTVTTPDGAPVAWAAVQALDPSDHAVIRTAYTDADGAYDLPLPPGDVVLEFSRYLLATEYYDDALDVAAAELVTLAQDQVRSGVDATLDWTTGLTGTVRDETGAPRGGVTVLVDGVARASTAADGTYRASASPGAHQVSFVAGFPYAPQYFAGVGTAEAATSVDVPADGVRPAVDATLWLLPGSITGTVVDQDGFEMSGVTVTATAGGDSYTAVTTRRGYEIVLPPGEYVVVFTSDSTDPAYRALWYELPVAVAAGTATSGVDAQMQVAEITLSGTVRSTAAAGAQGIPGVQVWAWDPAGGLTYGAITGADGRYTIGGLAPGEYVLRADTSLAPPYLGRFYGTGGQDADTAERIAVTWDDDATADLVLDRTASITGSVRDADGAPLMGALVDVADATTGESAGSGTTDADGGFVVEGLLPGSYTVEAHAFGRVSEYYDDATAPWTATVLELAEGGTVSIAMELAWDQWIEGVVTDADGSPVAGVTVTVSEWYGADVVAHTTTDASGAYAIGLLPGYYGVAFAEEGFVTEYYDDAVTRDASTMVMLMDAPSVADAQLAWAQGVSGTVVDEDGDPMAGVLVVAEDGDGPRSTSTGPDGGYALPLPPGAYVVSFSSDSANPVYETLYHDGALDPADAEPVAVAADAYTDVDAGMVVAWTVPTFVDVVEGQAFYDEITWLAAQGVATGWSDGTFRPTSPITREGVAAFLHRYAEHVLQQVTAATSVFSDVTPGNPFYADIMWLVDQGIATGWPDGTFRPSSLVERQAMAAFLYRLAGSPDLTPPTVSPFADVRPGDRFYAEICWLFDQGIATGTVTPSGRYFAPSAPIERQAMAAFLYRFDEAVGGRT